MTEIQTNAANAQGKDVGGCPVFHNDYRIAEGAELRERDDQLRLQSLPIEWS